MLAYTDRPGLQRLLADIARGQVDIIVVYKVDRLTRSLADFARMVELFDAKGVSFVSVTQAFNTTSSMGRLTLNVLLSFAQFEREVTGERIRDKVAASKAKGLRMGGQPPLGYDIEEGRLAINDGEADRVRAIFRRYLELGSAKTLACEGVRSKRWVSQKGVERGGGPMGHARSTICCATLPIAASPAIMTSSMRTPIHRSSIMRFWTQFRLVSTRLQRPGEPSRPRAHVVRSTAGSSTIRAIRC